MTKIVYERNPWGILTVVPPPRIFWDNTELRWYEYTASGPVPSYAFNNFYPDGPYDPGCTGSAWWWYARMTPWIADALRKRYGSDRIRPDVYKNIRHPGLRWTGKKPEDVLIRRNGMTLEAIREYEKAKQFQIKEEIAFMESVDPSRVILDSRGIVRVIWDAFLSQ